MENLESDKKIFKVEITETTSRIIEIQANSKNDALEKVSDMYHEGEIILDYRDFIDTIIRLI